MSHIPSAAMPHAKTHDDEPAAPVKAAARRFPWLAVAAGGVLAIGTVIGAAAALAKPSRRRQRAPAKARRKK